MRIQQKSYLTLVNCLECDHQFDFFPGVDRCPACNGVWLDHGELEEITKFQEVGFLKNLFGLMGK